MHHPEDEECEHQTEDGLWKVQVFVEVDTTCLDEASYIIGENVTAIFPVERGKWYCGSAQGQVLFQGTFPGKPVG